MWVIMNNTWSGPLINISVTKSKNKKWERGATRLRHIKYIVHNFLLDPRKFKHLSYKNIIGDNWVNLNMDLFCSLFIW